MDIQLIVTVSSVVLLSTINFILILKVAKLENTLSKSPTLKYEYANAKLKEAQKLISEAGVK